MVRNLVENRQSTRSTTNPAAPAAQPPERGLHEDQRPHQRSHRGPAVQERAAQDHGQDAGDRDQDRQPGQAQRGPPPGPPPRRQAQQGPPRGGRDRAAHRRGDRHRGPGRPDREQEAGGHRAAQLPRLERAPHPPDQADALHDVPRRDRGGAGWRHRGGDGVDQARQGLQAGHRRQAAAGPAPDDPHRRLASWQLGGLIGVPGVATTCRGARGSPYDFKAI